MSDKKTVLLHDKHVLIGLDDHVVGIDEKYKSEYQYVKNNFCGLVVSNENDFPEIQNTMIYLCGNIEKVLEIFKFTDIHTRLNQPSQNMLIVKELSYNYDHYSITTINIGEVPINIHNVGVYFRKLFNDDLNYFNLISKEHKFQMLTESNKPNNALRTGIYLTHVEESKESNESKDPEESTKFKLLRCSSNLSGPTDNFRDIDNKIVTKVNNVAKLFFDNPAELNHVLAQIYKNKYDDTGKEKKAKIKAHSDKTKDMPINALIAFTTFYDSDNDNDSKSDIFDLVYKNDSVLTKLHFKLKKEIKDEHYVKEFSIKLYPNSVFIISLETNRLYTHEIRPSTLPIDKMLTRMGYVIRCSKTNAIHKDDKTYIVEKDKLTELRYGTDEDFYSLRKLYFEENTTAKSIHYNNIYFTMNKGDLEKPLV